MTAKHSLPIVLFILLLAIQPALTACAPAGAPAQAASEAEPRRVAVQVAPVLTGDIAAVLSYAGSLQAAQQVDVTANYGSEIVELRADVGDAVHKGDVLLIFDTATLQIQATQAQAVLTVAEAQLARMKRGSRPEQLLAAQAALNLAQASLAGHNTATEAQIEAASGGVAQAQAVLKQAQSEYDKISWAGQVGMTPQALALEQATIAYETAMASYNAAVKGAPVERLALEASLVQAQSALALARDPFVAEDFAEAEANVKQARAALDLAQFQLDKATVKSPLAGRVAGRHVAVGDSPQPGSLLFTLISDQVEVILTVEEGRIGDVHKDQPAALRVVAYPGRDFPAVVTSVSPAADAKTHTFTLKVRPADDERLLKSGMFATVSLLGEEHAGTLLIPSAAVRRTAEQTTVFTVHDGRAELRPVTLGLAQTEMVEVIEGLSAGEQVAVTGQTGLADGSPVAIGNEVANQ